MTDGSTELYRKALNTALRILTGRDHSVAELRRKLVLRGTGEDLIRKVTAECLRLDYLNDERTARQLVRHAKSKGWGSLRLRGELARKGLAGEFIEALFQDEFSPQEERRLARRVLQKKMPSLQNEPDRGKRRLRIQRFLRSRGFLDPVIYDLLGEREPE
jgi:regulatory protein